MDGGAILGAVIAHGYTILCLEEILEGICIFETAKIRDGGNGHFCFPQMARNFGELCCRYELPH